MSTWAKTSKERLASTNIDLDDIPEMDDLARLTLSLRRSPQSAQA